ncbi:MAG: hypothetical protein OXH08_03695 [Gammaproteobacteria bacterium]|nr:hypothetical protein [Gammaproteobacteria bacterium]MDE0650034.1 hypothetical protein [Gammaproteobacteria bacterium]
MNDRPYQVLGDGVPRMLGRENLFRRLLGHLLKDTPDHVCVVGPTLFGKSVLLNHLGSHFKNQDDHYLTSVYWDLRHGTPRTDAEFRRRFVEQVKVALKSVRDDLAEDLDPEDEDPFELLEIVFEEMQSEGLRLLAVLDGFDHVLDSGTITRNFWDRMRLLAQRGSLRLVTGSRGRLRELCKSEDSRTSDFWEIFFDTPLRVGCFEEDDWDGFLQPFASKGVDVDEPARKEMANWTGGIPILAASLAQRLLEDSAVTNLVTKPVVDRVAGAMANEAPESIRQLWDDCPIEVQSLLADLASGEIPVGEVPPDRIRFLDGRGFVGTSRGKLRSACRLMKEFARTRQSNVATLRRLFGDKDRFEANLRGLLELRLEGIRNRVDPTLAGYALKAIRELPEPDHAIVWMRSFSETALDLIWNAELGRDNLLPEAWKATGIEFDEQGQLPVSRGQQCGILRKATGSANSPRVTRFLTKPAFLLVDHLHAVGNFGQHRDGAKISVPTAAAFCLSAIELCEKLANDLPKR